MKTKEKELYKEFLEWKTMTERTDQIFDIMKSIDVKLQTINERTKDHTLRIKQLEKKIK